MYKYIKVFVLTSCHDRNIKSDMNNFCKMFEEIDEIQELGSQESYMKYIESSNDVLDYKRIVKIGLQYS